MCARICTQGCLKGGWENIVDSINGLLYCLAGENKKLGIYADRETFLRYIVKKEKNKMQISEHS